MHVSYQQNNSHVLNVPAMLLAQLPTNALLSLLYALLSLLIFVYYSSVYFSNNNNKVVAVI